jgi:hypothetical protein
MEFMITGVYYAETSEKGITDLRTTYAPAMLEVFREDHGAIGG